MADGKGSRWKGYMGVPKHFVQINGQHLIERTVKILNKYRINEQMEIIVTSHDKRYEFEDCLRYEPKNNILEIDRFTDELIEDDMCFLYGDTYYTEECLQKILAYEPEDIIFFGNKKSIVAVKIKNSCLFKNHVNRVRKLYLEGILKTCVGWQVYQSFTGQDFNLPIQMDSKFVFVDENTLDINTPEDYREFKL